VPTQPQPKNAELLGGHLVGQQGQMASSPLLANAKAQDDQLPKYGAVGQHRQRFPMTIRENPLNNLSST
jgi:hypothetical protein